jgi:hypothetical protein
MRRIDRVSLLWLILLPFAPACYKYTPVESPERGMEVRAQLETEAAVRRSQGLDDAILRYDGVIVDITPETFTLDVLVARSTSAFQDVTIRDTITLETAEVRSLTRRTISPTRSALMALGTGVVAFGIVKSIDAIVGGTGDDDDGNGTPTMRIPVFSWTSLRLLPAFLRSGNEE